MESNGKGVDIDGRTLLPFEAGEIDFGEPGTRWPAQLLPASFHQGPVIPCDFTVGIVRSQQSVYLKVGEAWWAGGAAGGLGPWLSVTSSLPDTHGYCICLHWQCQVPGSRVVGAMAGEATSYELNLVPGASACH